MTESHLPVPAPSPGAFAPPGGPQGISPVAIASFSCGIGGLVLAVVVVGKLFVARPMADVVSWALPLGIVACIAAFVLGVVALIQIPNTRRRGKGLAAAGTVLGFAVPLLSTLTFLAGVFYACATSNGC